MALNTGKTEKQALQIEIFVVYLANDEMKIMKQITGKKSFLSYIRPGLLLPILAVLAALLLLSAVLELRGTRRELLHVLEEEAHSLMESIQIGGANAILAYEEIERQVSERLLNNAYLIDRLDQHSGLSSEKLAEIARQNSLFRINIFKTDGEKEISSFSGIHDAESQKQPPKDMLKPILDGQTSELIIGLRPERYGTGERYAVAIRRSRGGAIVVNIDAAEMLEFRRQFFIGRLVQDIGENAGLEYVVLQDTLGIILATRNITSLNSLSTDPFLIAALTSESGQSRIFSFENREVFETVQAFVLDGESLGLFRIGLSLVHVRAAETQAKQRVLLVSLVTLLVGLIALGLLITLQNYRFVQSAYHRIETYTGNILANMADAVVAIDLAGKITVFNNAAEMLFKIKAQDALGQSCTLVGPVLCEHLLAALQTQIVTDQEAEIELQNKKRILQFSLSFLRDGVGAVDSAFAVIRDLSEQKALAAQLQRSEKLSAMGELASGVAHEVRNPLNAIGMIAQRLNREFQPQSEAAEYHSLTQTVVAEVKRINQIIQQFLHYARPPKLNKVRCDWARFCQETVLLLQAPARQKGVALNATLVEVNIELDCDQMRQALVNLLQNALDATPSGGTITLECQTLPDWLQISIRDTGQGIKPEHMDKIFNLYFTTKPTGTGLGLSLVHQIISQHQGSIHVKSKWGVGTEFTIRLPLSERSNQEI